MYLPNDSMSIKYLTAVTINVIVKMLNVSYVYRT